MSRSCWWQHSWQQSKHRSLPEKNTLNLSSPIVLAKCIFFYKSQTWVCSFYSTGCYRSKKKVNDCSYIRIHCCTCSAVWNCASWFLLFTLPHSVLHIATSWWSVAGEGKSSVVMPRPAFNNPVTFTAGRLDINGHVHGQRWTVWFQYGHVHGWPLAVKILLIRLRTVIINAIEVWHACINRNGSWTIWA